MRELNFLRYCFLVPEVELNFWRVWIVVKGRVNVVSWRFMRDVMALRETAEVSRPNTELQAYFLIRLLYFCTQQVVPLRKLSLSQVLFILTPALFRNFFLKSSFLSLNSKFSASLLGFNLPDLMEVSSFYQSLDRVRVFNQCCLFLIQNNLDGSSVKLSLRISISVCGMRSAKKFFKFFLFKSKQFLSSLVVIVEWVFNTSSGQPTSVLSLFKNGLVLD